MTYEELARSDLVKQCFHAWPRIVEEHPDVVAKVEEQDRRCRGAGEDEKPATVQKLRGLLEGALQRVKS